MTNLLYHSVMQCCPAKLFYGEISTEDLRTLVEEVMIVHEYDPWKVKDELTSLEAEPVETVRHVITEGESTAKNLTRTKETSQGQSHTRTQGQEQSQGRSLGISRETGVTETMGETQNFTSGHVSTRGRASSSGEGTGINYVSGTAESILPDGNGGFLAGGEVIRTSSESSSRSSNSFSSDTESTSEGDIDTVGNAYSWTRGRSSSQGQNLTTSQTQGVSQSQSHGVQKGQSRAIAEGLTTGKNRGVTHTPFHEYKKRRIVSSRQFLSEQEQMTMALQKIKAQPKGHFLLKVPGHKAMFLRAPFVKTPWISERQRSKALERIFAQPHYASVQQIEIEEQERAQRIRALLPKETADQRTDADIPALPRSRKPPKMKRHSPPRSPEKLQTPWDTVDNDTRDRSDSDHEK